MLTVDLIRFVFSFPAVWRWTLSRSKGCVQQAAPAEARPPKYHLPTRLLPSAIFHCFTATNFAETEIDWANSRDTDISFLGNFLQIPAFWRFSGLSLHFAILAGNVWNFFVIEFHLLTNFLVLFTIYNFGGKIQKYLKNSNFAIFDFACISISRFFFRNVAVTNFAETQIDWANSADKYRGRRQAKQLCFHCWNSWNTATKINFQKNEIQDIELSKL